LLTIGFDVDIQILALPPDLIKSLPSKFSITQLINMIEIDEWQLGNTKAAPCELVSVPRRIKFYGELDA
jgi:hypothetical protein